MYESQAVSREPLPNNELRNHHPHATPALNPPHLFEPSSPTLPFTFLSRNSLLRSFLNPLNPHIPLSFLSSSLISSPSISFFLTFSSLQLLSLSLISL